MTAYLPSKAAFTRRLKFEASRRVGAGEIWARSAANSTIAAMRQSGPIGRRSPFSSKSVQPVIIQSQSNHDQHGAVA